MRTYFSIPRKGLLFLTILALKAGCAQPIKYPASRLDHPEARGTAPGEFGRVFLGSQGGHSVNLTPKTNERDWGTKLNSSLASPLLGAEFGLLKNFEVGFRIQSPSPLLLRAKVQLFGLPETKSVPGNFSLSLIGSTGFLYEASSVHSLTWNHQSWNGEGGVIAGYRLTQGMIFFGQPFFRYASMQLVPQENTDPYFGTKVTFLESSIYEYGMGIGSQIDWGDLFCRIEITWSKIRNERGARALFSPGLALGLRI
jgi:hypothetical protein